MVKLRWTKPDSDGGRPITHYVIEMKDKFSDWSEVRQAVTQPLNDIDMLGCSHSQDQIVTFVPLCQTFIAQTLVARILPTAYTRMY